MADTIAETTVIMVSPKGEKTPIHLEIGCPYRISGKGAACPVAMRGLYDELPDIHGADTLQALGLALGLMRQMIQHWEEQGHVFQHEYGQPFSFSVDTNL